MTEWRIVPDSNVEVSNDGRVRRDGVEFVPCINSSGYYILGVNTKSVYLHRLIAAVFVPNPLLKKKVDHINGDRLNNCVDNLRWVTDRENRHNSKSTIKKSGLPRGVKLRKSGRYYAFTEYDGKEYCLGTYDTPEEASEIYEVTAEELFGEFYRMP